MNSLLTRIVLLSVVLAPVAARGQSALEWGKARSAMVDLDLASNGISDPRVIGAMRSTPRHEFVPASQRKLAYFDMSLPIGDKQTISAPFAVAKMTEQLDPKKTDVVLEVGTGSGYQAAVLAGLVREVYTIEILDSLGKKAAERLKRLGYTNVICRIGDGYQGWAEHAPFDKIIVTCSPEKIPQPLVDQLREGGRMIIPIGERYQQTLTMLRKENGKLTVEALEPTYFVPMTGAAEELRQTPDPTTVSLVNGSFETPGKPAGQLDGWYYLRQATQEIDTARGGGGHVLRFTNATPGRSAQAIQAIGIDGRKVHALNVEVWARGAHIRPGAVPEQLPRVLLNFFDENRSPVGDSEKVGPWQGSFAWEKKSGQVKVPKKARLLIVAVGLLGATGDLSVDDMTLRPVE